MVRGNETGRASTLFRRGVSDRGERARAVDAPKTEHPGVAVCQFTGQFWTRKHESPARNYIPSPAVSRASRCNKILTISPHRFLARRRSRLPKMQVTTSAPRSRLKIAHARRPSCAVARRASRHQHYDAAGVRTSLATQKACDRHRDKTRR